MPSKKYHVPLSGGQSIADVLTALNTALGALDAGIATGFTASKGDLMAYSTAPEALAVGPNGYVLRANSVPSIGLAWDNVPAFAVLRHTETSGTDGGDLTGGTWNTRTLNSEYDPASLVTLASNTFTLPVNSSLLIVAMAQAFDVGLHKLRLRRGGTTTLATGGNADANVSNNLTSPAILIERLSNTSSQTFTIEHYVTTTKAASGMGQATSTGATEVYCTVLIFKMGYS